MNVPLTPSEMQETEQRAFNAWMQSLSTGAEYCYYLDRETALTKINKVRGWLSNVAPNDEQEMNRIWEALRGDS